MAAINVDPKSFEWKRVMDYIQTRGHELTEIATSPAVTDQERRDAAVRLDELKVLRGAPIESTEMVQGRIRGDETHRSIY